MMHVKKTRNEGKITKTWIPAARWPIILHDKMYSRAVRDLTVCRKQGQTLTHSTPIHTKMKIPSVLLQNHLTSTAIFMGQGGHRIP